LALGAFKEYENYDAVGLADLVHRGEVTPEELLDAAVERVEARNPAINAVVMPMYDEARRIIKAKLPQGPLRGVPFLLKDLGLFYKGFATTFGSRLYRDFFPDHHSTLVERYLKAGLVIFGKTNTPEFGITVTTEPELYGPSRNPWNLERTPGGSSGGAAAAVAAGMLPAAHASDGGGSIRIPAACCGLFGLKPTRGRIPSGPERGEEWGGMSSHHVITRTVRDSAAFLDVAAGPAPGDPYWAPPACGPFLAQVGKPPGVLRIAYTTRSPGAMDVHPECIGAVHRAVQLCSELGHRLEEACPDYDVDAYQRAAGNIIDAHTALMMDDRAKAMDRRIRPEEVEYVTWRSAQAGKRVSASDYVSAMRTIHRTSRRVAPFFETYDILLSPVLLQPPVPLGYLDTHSQEVRTYVKNLFSFFGFTSLFNGTGQPSMSVPLDWTRDNLPIGLLFSGRFGEDALLLRLAAQLEAARPWGFVKKELPRELRSGPPSGDQQLV
jgi:amidase